MKKTFFVFIWLLGLHAVGLAQGQRVVSLSGAVSEIMVELGLESLLVGTDITSNYPASVDKLPKVGHNRNVGAEATLSLRPTLIVGTKDEKGQSFLRPEVEEQFKSSGIRVVTFTQTYSVEGTKKLINDVAALFGRKAQADKIIKKLDAQIGKVKKPARAPKVLFIYARGLGTMSVAGKDTQAKSIIELAGGQNATDGFSGFKPLTAEALIAANPDYLLLFDSGLESLGGIDGLLKVPGVAQTNAGKNRKVIEMDGVLLLGFTPRLGDAVIQLNEKIKK